MHMNPYLSFDGDCEAAFTFYRRVLGGRIEIMLSHGESPVCDDVPFEWYDRIMHAQLAFGDSVLMGADAPPGHFEKPSGICVALAFDDPGEAERVYHELSEGGSVQMRIQETFWAKRFGMVTDRYGIPWIINGGLVQLDSMTEQEANQCAS